MSSEQNTQTQADLTREIKSLRELCANTYNIIANNTPTELQALNVGNVQENALNYVKGLHTQIENTLTVVPTDGNLVTGQFLNDITEKNKQIDEMSAFTKGCIHDVENEIKRLNINIETAQEAKSRPWSDKQEVKMEHVEEAQERFRLLKSELYSVIFTLFPNKADAMLEVLTQLTTAKMNESATGYIEVTPENYRVIQLLSDINVITPNPYNNMEVKLAY